MSKSRLEPGDVGSEAGGLTHVCFAIVASAEYLNTLFVGQELVKHELLKGGGVSAIRVSVILERVSPRPEDGKSVLGIILFERPGGDVVITKDLGWCCLGGRPVMVDEVKQIETALVCRAILVAITDCQSCEEFATVSNQSHARNTGGHDREFFKRLRLVNVVFPPPSTNVTCWLGWLSELVTAYMCLSIKLRKRLSELPNC